MTIYRMSTFRSRIKFFIIVHRRREWWLCLILVCFWPSFPCFLASESQCRIHTAKLFFRGNWYWHLISPPIWACRFSSLCLQLGHFLFHIVPRLSWGEGLQALKTALKAAWVWVGYYKTDVALIMVNFQLANHGLFLFLFVLFEHNLKKRLTSLAGFELGLLE